VIVLLCLHKYVRRVLVCFSMLCLFTVTKSQSPLEPFTHPIPAGSDFRRCYRNERHCGSGILLVVQGEHTFLVISVISVFNNQWVAHLQLMVRYKCMQDEAERDRDVARDAQH
jgi:hypothetical protein